MNAAARNVTIYGKKTVSLPSERPFTVIARIATVIKLNPRNRKAARRPVAAATRKADEEVICYWLTGTRKLWNKTTDKSMMAIRRLVSRGVR
jgi:hypothetical protein